jgi:hypothetical protein
MSFFVRLTEITYTFTMLEETSKQAYRWNQKQSWDYIFIRYFLYPNHMRLKKPSGPTFQKASGMCGIY